MVQNTLAASARLSDEDVARLAAETLSEEQNARFRLNKLAEARQNGELSGCHGIPADEETQCTMSGDDVDRKVRGVIRRARRQLRHLTQAAR